MFSTPITIPAAAPIMMMSSTAIPAPFETRFALLSNAGVLLFV
jgi:hypothetical protein